MYVGFNLFSATTYILPPPPAGLSTSVSASSSVRRTPLQNLGARCQHFPLRFRTTYSLSSRMGRFQRRQRADARIEGMDRHREVLGVDARCHGAAKDGECVKDSCARQRSRRRSRRHVELEPNESDHALLCRRMAHVCEHDRYRTGKGYSCQLVSLLMLKF